MESAGGSSLEAVGAPVAAGSILCATRNQVLVTACSGIYSYKFSTISSKDSEATLIIRDEKLQHVWITHCVVWASEEQA